MVKQILRWGPVLLLVPVLGCGSTGSTADIPGDGAADSASPGPAAPDKPAVEQPPSKPAQGSAGSAKTSRGEMPASPVALPKAPVDEELRRQVAQLYSPQIKELLEEVKQTSGGSPLDIRLKAQERMAEADRLRADAVAYIQSLDEKAFDKLKGAMLDPSVDVRRGAAWYLFENINKNDPQMVAVFVQALSDDDRLVRQMAIAGLKGLPPESLSQFLPQLVALLQRGDEESGDRAAIANLIGRLGLDAASALPVLVQLAHDDADADVRKQCLLAASRIAPDDQSVAMFRTALSDSDVGVRKMAVLRLGRLGASAAVAAGDLSQALKDADPDVRQYAANSLGRLGLHAAPAVGALGEAMADEKANVRNAAAGALVNLGDLAVDPLCKQLESPSVEARKLAISTLGRMVPPPTRAVPALKERLSDSDSTVRQLAAVVLEQLEDLP